MDWLKKYNDDVIHTELSRSEYFAVDVYKAMFCQLEKQPTKKQLSNILHKKELDFLDKYLSDFGSLLDDFVTTSISFNNNKREYNKKRSASVREKDKIVVNNLSTDCQQVVSLDKIRVDKRRRKENIKKIKVQEIMVTNVPPTMREVIDDFEKYLKIKNIFSINCEIEAEKFIAFHEKNEWVYKKKKITNWKLHANTWKPGMLQQTGKAVIKTDQYSSIPYSQRPILPGYAEPIMTEYEFEEYQKNTIGIEQEENDFE